MTTVTISPPNAILFVFDPTNKAVAVPRYVNGELTAATESCVSVGTQASIDGDVEVSLELNGTKQSGLHQVFEGAITVQSGKVAVVTSEYMPVLNLDVMSEIVDVSVWVDDCRSPARVAIRVKEIAGTGPISDARIQTAR